jgi:HlyD family secretion protein
VPSSAVVARDGSWYVLRVRDGALEQVTVRTGETMGDRTEILSGISPGDSIVRKPTDALRPGMSVTLK